MVDVKKSSKCGNKQLKSNFHKDKSTKDKLYSSCKICVNQRKVEWRKNNYEKYKCYSREYFQQKKIIMKDINLILENVSNR